MDIFESNIDILINLIEQKTGKDSVLYIELISLEIKENSFFNIKCKGYNIDCYDRDVRDHLRNEENSSLLLLKHDNNTPFFFLQKEINNNYEPENDFNQDKKYKFYNDRKYHKVEHVININFHWEKWVEMAQKSFPSLRHACFLHSNLTIPLSKHSVEITSAAWVFFSKPVSEYELIDLQGILKTGIYEYIIYTLLPNKIEQIERQDTFNRLYHAQNEYINTLHNLSWELQQHDKELGMYQAVICNNLASFKDIIRVSQESSVIENENISLSKVIYDLVWMFIRIFKDDRINHLIYPKITGSRLNAIILQSKENSESLFNIETLGSDQYMVNCPKGMPQLVIKEAVSNAIKYNNVTNPQIFINLNVFEGYYFLSIKNMFLADSKELEKMCNPDNNTSYGMKIIHLLCERMNWEIKCDCDLNEKSTIVCFKIPL